MNGLHPIIRRKRRPLYVEDVPPSPAKLTADGQQAESGPAPAKKTKASDAKSTANPAAS